MIEIRSVEGRVRVAGKARYHNEWDPPVGPYDPYGRATCETAIVTEFQGMGGDLCVFFRGRTRTKQREAGSPMGSSNN